MAETRFTPGPWDLLAGCYTPENGYFWMVQVADRTTAYAFEEANAHLTATGPELYADLQECVDALAAATRLGVRGYEELVLACRKTLAKARGEPV